MDIRESCVGCLLSSRRSRRQSSPWTRQSTTRQRHIARAALCRLDGRRTAPILQTYRGIAPIGPVWRTHETPQAPNTPRAPSYRLHVGWPSLVVTGPFRGLEASRIPEWSQPENFGPEVNSAFEDLAPHLSSDGLALYLASTRPESLGGEDLWVARRASRHDPWGPATSIGRRSTPLPTNAHRRCLTTGGCCSSPRIVRVDRGASTSGFRGAPIPTTISAGSRR